MKKSRLFLVPIFAMAVGALSSCDSVDKLATMAVDIQSQITDMQGEIDALKNETEALKKQIADLDTEKSAAIKKAEEAEEQGPADIPRLFCRRLLLLVPGEHGRGARDEVHLRHRAEAPALRRHRHRRAIGKADPRGARQRREDIGLPNTPHVPPAECRLP